MFRIPAWIAHLVESPLSVQEVTSSNPMTTPYQGVKNGFVCLFALRPKSTALVIAGRSVHLTTLFPGQA